MDGFFPGFYSLPSKLTWNYKKSVEYIKIFSSVPPNNALTIFSVANRWLCSHIKLVTPGTLSPLGRIYEDYIHFV
jgi:hypothetical protein